MEGQPTLEQAIALAARAHEGQIDKGGETYILHPLRVMLRMETPEERLVAILHDVVEDTPVTLEELRARGFDARVLEAVDCLTRREGESYDAFIQRIKPNPLARRVKLGDLEDNLNLTRLSPAAHDEERVARYRRALESLAG
jgi:(p)ppGpp synthase/HD superfamily hydrolase